MATNSQKAARKLWVKALRRGEYRKVKGTLHREGKFCCLGVLCYLAVKAKVIEPFNLESLYWGDSLALHRAVMAWVGLADAIGSYEESGANLSLAALNDGADNKRALTFKQIADVIESEPKGLFE